MHNLSRPYTSTQDVHDTPCTAHHVPRQATKMSMTRHAQLITSLAKATTSKQNQPMLWTRNVSRSVAHYFTAECAIVDQNPTQSTTKNGQNYASAIKMVFRFL
eukprot:g70759.t1